MSNWTRPSPNVVLWCDVVCCQNVSRWHCVSMALVRVVSKCRLFTCHSVSELWPSWHSVSALCHLCQTCQHSQSTWLTHRPTTDCHRGIGEICSATQCWFTTTQCWMGMTQCWMGLQETTQPVWHCQQRAQLTSLRTWTRLDSTRIIARLTAASSAARLEANWAEYQLNSRPRHMPPADHWTMTQVWQALQVIIGWQWQWHLVVEMTVTLCLQVMLHRRGRLGRHCSRYWMRCSHWWPVVTHLWWPVVTQHWPVVTHLWWPVVTQHWPVVTHLWWPVVTHLWWPVVTHLWWPVVTHLWWLLVSYLWWPVVTHLWWPVVNQRLTCCRLMWVL